ncbi:hypothetical protein NDN08_002032 [Rhodosorus marinus]|uniref:General transcription and DNA repair factor IIH subunit TFB5 n=1 Tax=Rhodosorus marinus TaxID=101924 RepID=A0AAV8USJ6_9RHOD|nr:hypothetical protein NDN08_002032 [Rhodosorus marinus]
MVHFTEGVLVACDVPTKQFILKLDADLKPRSFVLFDLDDNHIFVEGWAVETIRNNLEELYKENHFTFIA